MRELVLFLVWFGGTMAFLTSFPPMYRNVVLARSNTSLYGCLDGMEGAG